MDWSYSAGVIIFCESDQRKYIIIQEHTDHWFFPKGHLEKGETNEQAALREVGEELNEQVDLIPGYEEIMEYPIGNGMMKRVTFFLSKHPFKELFFDKNEIKDAKWLTLKQAINTLDHDNSRQLLRKTDAWINEWMKKQ